MRRGALGAAVGLLLVEYQPLLPPSCGAQLLFQRPAHTQQCPCGREVTDLFPCKPTAAPRALASGSRCFFQRPSQVRPELPPAEGGTGPGQRGWSSDKAAAPPSAPAGTSGPARSRGEAEAGRGAAASPQRARARPR